MKSFFFLIPLLFVFSFCTNDQLPEMPELECTEALTYTDDIKIIIDQSCAYEGCHAAGFGSGDYSTFSGMRVAINSGTFESRVVAIRNMPPDYAPSDRPRALSQEDLEIVQCWIQNGYAE